MQARPRLQTLLRSTLRNPTRILDLESHSHRITRPRTSEWTCDRCGDRLYRDRETAGRFPSIRIRHLKSVVGQAQWECSTACETCSLSSRWAVQLSVPTGGV